MSFATEYFLPDIAAHKMSVIMDEGVYRHIRFKKPETISMYFDIITWPGHMCFTGDMGTYVFSRLPDMIDFFRRDKGRERFRIDFRYWAEKVQADDKHGRIKEWSAEKFKAAVKAYFDDRVEDYLSDTDSDLSADDLKAELWDDIYDRVISPADESEHHAWTALHEFEHDGFQFVDWESDCKVWSHRFLWCCHAIEWAVETYETRKLIMHAMRKLRRDGFTEEKYFPEEYRLMVRSPDIRKARVYVDGKVFMSHPTTGVYEEVAL